MTDRFLYRQDMEARGQIHSAYFQQKSRDYSGFFFMQNEQEADSLFRVVLLPFPTEQRITFRIFWFAINLVIFPHCSFPRKPVALEQL